MSRPIPARGKSRVFLIGSALCVLSIAAAQAHPHVWITMSENLVFTVDGKLSNIESIWAFDELYSAFATQGLPTDADGHLKPETLLQLADNFTKKLAPVNYFTSVKSDGTELNFDASINNNVEFDGKQIVYHFTLPLKEPAKLGAITVFTTIDPINFVAFSSRDHGPAVELVGNANGCSLDKKEPPAETPAPLAPNDNGPDTNPTGPILPSINAPHFSIYC